MDNRLWLSLSVLCVTLSLGCAEDPPAPPVLNVMNDMEAARAAAEAEAMAEARAAAANSVPAADPAGNSDSDVIQEGRYVVQFDTTAGSFTIEVDRSWAPIGADRFYKLVKSGFYDETGFFRVLPDFMVQWGIAANPADNARWDASIMDDPVKKSNKRSYVTFAKTGAPNSRTTQVFINYKDNSFLDGQGFAPFGQVTKGMDVVTKINSTYGETPDQGAITAQGSSYLKANFPGLDYVKTARIIEDDVPDDAIKAVEEMLKSADPTAIPPPDDAAKP